MNVILQQPTPDVAFVTRLRFLLFEQKDGARLAYLEAVSTHFFDLLLGPLEFPFKWTDFKKTTAGFAENVLASFDEFPGHLYEREQF